MKKLFFGLMLLAGGVNFSPQQAEAAAAPNKEAQVVPDPRCSSGWLFRCVEEEGGTCTSTEETCTSEPPPGA